MGSYRYTGIFPRESSSFLAGEGLITVVMSAISVSVKFPEPGADAGQAEGRAEGLQRGPTAGPPHRRRLQDLHGRLRDVLLLQGSAQGDGQALRRD